MQIHRTTCRWLAVLASFGLCVANVSADDKKDAPKSLPPEIVKAWTDAGAKVGWMKDVPPTPEGGYQFWEPYLENAEAGAMPAFNFHPKKANELATLPNPGMPFGIDFHCSGVTATWIKNMKGLKSLRSLNVGGALTLKDDGLKELTALKNLEGLYLFYTHVTDAGMKDLAELKSLRALDLSNTRVSDAGMKELAALKNLQALNLGSTSVSDAGLKDLARLKNLQTLNLDRTRATAAGVAALQKELPMCKIAFISH